MASFKIVIDKRVRKKDVPLIPYKIRAKIFERISKLASDPFPAEAIQLKGRNEWRIRQGSYRILYVVHDQVLTIIILRVGHRKDVYK